jgi:[pyruvate, water dikinase]-phosphate phosphotransferase / [pyruvate, water dikinase] kinase
MFNQCEKTTVCPTGQTATSIYVLSDSTGNLGRHMVMSFLTQFPPDSFHVHVKTYVGDPARLDEAFAAITGASSVVFHAVVSERLKRRIARRCRQRGVPCTDLTGPAVKFLASASHIKPLHREQPLHPVDLLYCDRISAMDFTLAHDDSLGMERLADADIVLVGVSRTGKTPTSVYLAMQGFRVANISLSNGVPVPQELLNLTTKKIVGLVIDAERLTEIRTRRQLAWNMSSTAYNDRDAVEEEVRWCRRVFAQLSCPVLDVTNRAIEETAARILEVLGLSEPIHHANSTLLT